MYTNKLSPGSWTFYAAIITGSLSFLLGVLVLYGWYTQSLALIQINPSFVPMQFNTALGFFMAGLGLMALCGNLYRIVIFFGLLTFAVGAGTLIEYITAVDLHIDQLFMQHYINIQTSHPGRMAPNTALCFSLCGSTLLVAVVCKNARITPAIIGTLGIIIAGLGIVALMGYFTGIETAYGWGHLTKMAIHTALGFTILGAGFFAYGWASEQRYVAGIPTWLSVTIGIVSMTVTLALWQALVVQEQTQFEISGKQTLIEESVLFFGTLLSLILVYISRSSLKTDGQYQSGKIVFVPIIVVAAGLFMALSLFSLLHNNFQENLHNRFKADAENRIEAIEYGMTLYIESLFSIRAGFNASRFVDRHEFYVLVERLMHRFPGIRSLEWIPRVSAEQRGQFEAEIPENIARDFTFFKYNDSGEKQAVEQQEWYYPVYYIEPLSAGSEFIGFDLTSIPEQFQALMRAVNINAPAVSVPFKLNDKSYEGYGILVALPVYQRDKLLDTAEQRSDALKGFVVAVIEIGSMIEDILEENDEVSGLDLQFFDAGSTATDLLLFHHHSVVHDDNTVEDIPGFLYTSKHALQVAEKKWDVVAFPASSELFPEWSSHTLDLPIAIFLLSSLLAYYLRRTGIREIERSEMLAYQAALLDAIPNPIFVYNNRAELTSCNKAYEQVFGIKRGDYLGKRAEDQTYYSKQTQRLLDNGNQSLLSSGESTSEEITITYRNGDKHDVIYLRTPFKVAYSHSDSMIGILVDITERKQAEDELTESKNRLALTIAGSGDGLWDYDISSGEFWYSDRFRELLGYSSDDAFPNIIESWSEALHPDDHDATMNAFKTHLVHDAPYDVEYRLMTRDGEYRWFHARGKSLRNENGQSYRAAGSLSDITELKKSQKLAELAQRIAEEANQAKSDFLANMSHEIRTPMNAIIGMSYLALQTELSGKQRNYIDKVHRSADALLGIINDILDFSKIEAGKMDLESIEFRFEDVLDNLSNLLGLKTEERGLELLFDIDPEMPMALRGDPLRLGQVLINLGNNAVKFTEQGEVVISSQVIESDDKKITVQFSVRDTGIGMSEQQQSKLFQSFSQADGSITRKFGGTGLGLVICRKLTEMMDGKIWVNSKEGQGSTFYFTARLERGEEIPSLEMDAKMEPISVLVVDDNKSSREILVAMLESLKFKAESVTSGNEAIKQIETAEKAQQPYDLILMDWKMPGMDGVETIRQLQDDSKLEDIPTIIMVTAHSKEELAEATKNVGKIGLLTKPTNASFLFESILTAFNRKITSRSRRIERQDDYTEAVRQLRGAKVLLVEDNEINQELALELLSNGGIITALAENGREAVEKAETEPFDGILMDIQMPVMDGYTATKLIRQLQGCSEMPIIAMTANAMAGDIEKTRNSGMNDHISKPINVAEMFCTMARWITPADPALETDQKRTPLPETPPDDEQTMPHIDGIDIEAGLVIAQENRKLYKRLLIKFLETQKNFCGNFSLDYQSGNHEEAIRSAHTLKGVAGNIGAREVFKAAEKLETLCNEKAKAGLIDAALEELNVVLMKVIHSLEEMQQTLMPVRSSHQDIQQDTLQPLFKKLMNLLQDDDADAVEVLEQIADYVREEPDIKTLKNLESLVDQYAYEEAIEVVKTLASNLSIELSD